MATMTKIGPADHGRPMALDDFLSSDGQEGYHYELIAGKLYVTPQPNAPQGRIEWWVFTKLLVYSLHHPDALNYVHPKARVFVSGGPEVTAPEPDVTAYRDFPLHLSLAEVQWQDASPVLVAEIVSVDDPDKDLVRNVALYLQVDTIREYWVFDNREDADRPSLTVYRRRGEKWQKPIRIHYGETYTTKLLPEFELLVDPRS